ncbi:MAG: DUF937 domain-containing protein [Pseudomonadota bacterium]
MNMLEILAQAQGGQGMDALARKFGVDPATAESVARSVLPALSSGVKRRAAEPDGLASIAAMIKDTDVEAAFDAPEANEDLAQQKGAAFLENLFGGSRSQVEGAVAERAAQQSGVGADLVQSMLPMLASMVLGGMQKRESQDPGLSEVVGGLMGGSTSQAQAGGGLGGLLGAFGGGKSQTGGASNMDALTAMFDADGDGSAADDILEMVMKR